MKRKFMIIGCVAIILSAAFLVVQVSSSVRTAHALEPVSAEMTDLSNGAGGLALAMDMMQYRPYFIALTVVFLAAGFYFAYRPEKLECAPGSVCATPKNRRLQRVSLWVVAILTLALLAFPYLIPYLPIE